MAYFKVLYKLPLKEAKEGEENARLEHRETSCTQSIFERGVFQIQLRHVAAVLTGSVLQFRYFNERNEVAFGSYVYNGHRLKIWRLCSTLISVPNRMCPTHDRLLKTICMNVFQTYWAISHTKIANRRTKTFQ